ncbi:MAG TPA: DegV family protein [Symbiobacteriaceae bacterium]|jgi:DegV family protein with EDD domain
MTAARVRVLCDSCCDLPEELFERYQIARIPMMITFGNESLRDVYDITKDAFYERLVQERTVPTTSQITPASYLQYFQEAVADGGEAVYISLSSGLSASVQNAVTVAAEFEGRVQVVDSLAASAGIGLQVLRAAELAEAGQSARAIAADIEAYRTRICHAFTIDTLEFARRSGRITNIAALAAGVLDIKPVLFIDMAGRLIPMDKVRGRKRSLNRLFEELERLAPDPRGHRVGVCYAGAAYLPEAERTEERLRTQYGVTEIYRVHVSPTIGSHVGPGTLALVFEGPEGRGC